MLAIDFPDFSKVRDWMESGKPAMLVELAEAAGSTPREQGAAMAVAADATAGTIGGGQLEWMAMAKARELLAAGRQSADQEVALGPAIGQCCGGRVKLRYSLLDNESVAALGRAAMAGRSARADVLIFGAGHTGKALALALDPLPVHAVLVDPRAEALATAGAAAETRLAAVPEALVAGAKPGSAYVAMTHEHSLDFLICAEALRRDDAAYCGMIGSETKRQVFVNWLGDNGFDPAMAARLVCPIGGAEVRDKRPAVIAALTAAEIVAALHRYGSLSIRNG